MAKARKYEPMVYLDLLFMMEEYCVSPTPRYAWHFFIAAIKSEKFLESGD